VSPVDNAPALVSLRGARSPHGPVSSFVAASLPGVESVEDALLLATRLTHLQPFPGDGASATLDLWESLATLAAFDLGVARAIEPHVDALAILDQARDGQAEDDMAGLDPAGALALPGNSPSTDRTWGVFAAEGANVRLTATPRATPEATLSAIPETAGGQDARGTSIPDPVWVLDGTKPWCSLGGSLDAALVTAWVDDETRGLFAVDLHQPGVRVDADGWHARGLSEIPSNPIRFDRVEAVAVGGPGWYLTRPGFSWGAMGVAACWFGGAVGLARTLLETVQSNPRPDPFLFLHLGAVDTALGNAARVLTEAASAVDAGRATGGEGRLLAKRVRTTVHAAAEEVVRHVAHALGPAPLAHDSRHAKRVADLELYLRQHHAERDDASLGRAVAEADAPW